ncbi:MAG: aromatic ring-hydroxylating dioxygenase subunit alpha [Pseudomonadota bacterium]
MDERLAAVISSSERDAVMCDINEATSLPAQAYTSKDWFDLEVERIFMTRWTAVMFECVLPSPGDAKPFQLFGMPLFAVRGQDGRLRVFHNICPYDGCQVVTAPKKGLKHLHVFYHAWRYDFTGRLIEAPFWNGKPDCKADDLNKLKTSLAEIRCEVRYGVVFVDLGGKSEEIDKWLEPWRKTVGAHFAIDELVPAVSANGLPLIEERTVASNWKTYQENASINLLHEAHVHSIYRKSPEVPRVDNDGTPLYQTFCDKCFIAFSHGRDDSGETYDKINLPMAGHDPKVQPEVGYFSTVYPNVNIPLLDAMIKVNIAIPVAPDRTDLMHLRFYRPEAVSAEQFQDEEQAVQKVFDIIHKEDQRAIESVQRARSSPAFRQHYYSPAWDHMHHYFNHLVMSDLGVGP